MDVYEERMLAEIIQQYVIMLNSKSNLTTSRYGVPDAGDDYDPHLHRFPEHPTNYFDTLVHIIKGCLGTAILAMPLAFKEAGWISGIIGSVFICCLTTYGIHILFDSRYKMCKDLKIANIPYAIITKLSLLQGPHKLRKWSHCFGIMIDVIMVVHQTGTCSAYLIFIGDNIQDLWQEIDKNAEPSEKLIILALFPLLILIVSVPNMKMMSIFSLISNILMVVAIVIAFGVLLSDIPYSPERLKFGTAFDTLFSFGIIFFAFSGMGVLLQAEKDMRNPKQLTTVFGTLNISMAVILLLHAATGFVGYWSLGEETKDSFTLNLNEINEAAGISVQVIFVLTIYVTYGLQAMVPVEILWVSYLRWFSLGQKYSSIGIQLTRLFIVLMSIICAVAIPLFGQIVSLLGAFGVTTIGLIIPAIVHICVIWFRKCEFKVFIIFVDFIVLLLGFGMFILGSYIAIDSIKKALPELHKT